MNISAQMKEPENKVNLGAVAQATSSIKVSNPTDAMLTISIFTHQHQQQKRRKKRRVKANGTHTKFTLYSPLLFSLLALSHPPNVRSHPESFFFLVSAKDNKVVLLCFFSVCMFYCQKLGNIKTNTHCGHGSCPFCFLWTLSTMFTYYLDMDGWVSMQKQTKEA